MTLRLSRGLAAKIEHAFDLATSEICGLVIGFEDLEYADDIIWLPNLADSVAHSFAVNMSEIQGHRVALARAANQRTMLAFLHTHPHGSTTPSCRDLTIPRLTGLLSVIVAKRGETMCASCHGFSNGRTFPVEVVVVPNKSATRAHVEKLELWERERRNSEDAITDAKLVLNRSRDGGLLRAGMVQLLNTVGIKGLVDAGVDVAGRAAAAIAEAKDARDVGAWEAEVARRDLEDV